MARLLFYSRPTALLRQNSFSTSWNSVAIHSRSSRTCSSVISELSREGEPRTAKPGSSLVSLRCPVTTRHRHSSSFARWTTYFNDRNSQHTAASALTKPHSLQGVFRRGCSSAARSSQRQDDKSIGARSVQLGSDQDWIFPSNRLQQLEDSNNLMNDGTALRQELAEKGYLFIRGLHDRQAVLNARLAVLEHIDKVNGDALDLTEHELREGVLDSRCGAGCVPFMEGRNSITHSDAVSNVLESERAKKFFSTLFGESVRTFDFKWLRGIHRAGYTGAHVDNVYMSRGTDRLLTCWQPLGDTPVEMGTLAVCEGSHRLPQFATFQETYGNFDVELGKLQGTGWFTEDPKEILAFGGQWKTSDFRAGDALIFTLRTVHMSTANQTHFARISCDTRWQPAAESADHRYVGDIVGHADAKFGVHAKEKEVGTGEQDDQLRTGVTMASLRQAWGI
eukprot:scpid68644/ scgid4501/ 